jgi:5-methylthioadenosine/S-adenosylhomocysteine deaminase
VLLKVKAINTAPMVDPIGTIVVFADTSNVDSVFVAGRAIKRNGQLVDQNLENVFQKLDESRNHILSRGELLPVWASAPMAAV